MIAKNPAANILFPETLTHQCLQFRPPPATTFNRRQQVARLLRPNRLFQGTPEVCRAPQVEDIGTLVYAYDVTSFAVECVNTDGMTVWLADFFAEELEFFGRTKRRGRGNRARSSEQAMIQPIQIREFVVRLPEPMYPYQGKTRIQIRKVTTVAQSEPGWMPVTALVGQFFQPAFDKRNQFNIPGPFYGAETDTCETGTAEAPHNVLLDRSGQEFVFTQPRYEDELRDIISAAICECFVGYGADGDDHWTLALIQEWWRSRPDLLDLSSHATGLPESKRRLERILSGEGEAYLRSYAFFIEIRRLPSCNDPLPEIGQ